MTQKEAIVRALKTLGGRAPLQEIYPLAIEIGNFGGSKNKEATIRNCLQTSPKFFRRSPDKPAGWWELISYQEEIDKRDKLIAEKDKIIERLKQVKTEDDFVERFFEKAKLFWKRDKKIIDEIRKIMDALGREDVVCKLDTWMEKQSKQSKKSSPQQITVGGDYVVSKHVDNEVNGVASGAIGVKINKE